ncbi:Impact [Trypanosoma melophagium]|uniref:Impact n=1 Tax=Trypanosoma melophagium TaxID=715481 RepID=UPI00351A80F6|nr:Impact [Trypanosoma melophagium]
MQESDDIAEEMEMLLATCTDEVRRHPTDPATLIVSLPFRFVLHITMPPRGYPLTARPHLIITEGPNAPLVSSFAAQLTPAVRESIPLGAPMLLQIVTVAQRLAAEIEETHNTAVANAEAEREAEKVQLLQKYAEQEAAAVEVWAGTPITDRKSKFVAHMARIRNEKDVRDVVMHLRQEKSIAEAAHPTIYAYRYIDSVGVVHQDCDDDGETGAAGRILFLLEQMKVNGYVIVVTRWFGGILLGPDRFKHIMEVSRNMLLTIPQREGEEKEG